MTFKASRSGKSNRSKKASRTGRSFAYAMTAGLVALSAIFVATPGLAQSSTIQHDSAKARTMKEPSFQTREERLNAKPLDWNTTIGTPKPRTLTAAERKALQTAKPELSGGGAPNPKAEEEARKLHPDDWK